MVGEADESSVSMIGEENENVVLVSTKSVSLIIL